MQAQRVIALAKRGNKMSVAISDPTNIQALDQIKFQSEASVEPVIVPHDALLALLAGLGKSADKACTNWPATSRKSNWPRKTRRPRWRRTPPTTSKTRRSSSSSTRS